MVKLALLGATGSVGSSTIEVVKEQAEHFAISLSSAHLNWHKLCEIACELSIPQLVFTGIEDTSQQTFIRNQYPSLKIYFGISELLNLLKNEDYDLALNAISGSAGLKSSFAIAQRGKNLALANKESLAMAGHLLMPLIKSQGSKILPVDSEHSAVFQLLEGHPHNEIRKIYITASGGALRDIPLNELENITLERALQHPNWSMGTKVTLDSATMFNKALEVMEAHWLFNLDFEQIDCVLHPQSVVHSLVEFIDGAIFAQMSQPDMKLPILYALSYPERLPSKLVQTDLKHLGNLEFSPIPTERYPLFILGLQVAYAGGILPTVLNSANEAALRLFQAGIIRYADIYLICQEAVNNCINEPEPSLEQILMVNEQVFQRILKEYNFGAIQ
jgi:1-deoxy-D-xylulose-5-phosphate reductoisomerase